MKKTFFALLIYFFGISFAQALVSDYNIEVTILDDSSILVQEVIIMEDEYYGFEKNIKYDDIYSDYYNNIVSLGHEYNYSVVIDSIKGINYASDKTMQTLYEQGDDFKLVDEAVKGEYGVYTSSDIDSLLELKIYNNSQMNKDLLITYHIKDLIISHADANELLYNLFTNLKEDISNLNIKINIEVDEDLLVYVHKHDANINLFDEYVEIELLDIIRDSEIDFRLIYNNDIIASKETDISILTTIDQIEETLKYHTNIGNVEYRILRNEVYNAYIKAFNTKDRNDYNIALSKLEFLNEDDALKVDLQIKLHSLESIITRNEEIISVLVSIPIFIWILFVLVYNYLVYKRKETGISLDINNLKIESIFYLRNKKINQKALIISFLNMIERKVITVRETKLNTIYTINEEVKLDEADKRLITIFFNNKNKITLKQMSNLADKEFKERLVSYSKWVNIVSFNCVNLEMFMSLFKYKITNYITSLVGIVMYFILIDYNLYYDPSIILYLSIIYFIFTILIYQRTHNGKKLHDKLKDSNDYIVKIIYKKQKLTNEQIKIAADLKNILKKVHYLNKVN